MTSPFTGLKSIIALSLQGIDRGNAVLSLSHHQVRMASRMNWPDWRMLKDHNKRMCVKQYGAERDRINTIRKCDILPREIREIADKEVVEKVPRNSNYIRTWPRCVISSRPRGVVKDWRLGRFVYRHLADYNKLSGVQRGLW